MPQSMPRHRTKRLSSDRFFAGDKILLIRPLCRNINCTGYSSSKELLMKFSADRVHGKVAKCPDLDYVFCDDETFLSKPVPFEPRS